MKNKPRYAIESVEHALHLAQLLRLEGPLRVTDAAARLGVSASTAHRLLAMLVYRDFAEQDEHKRYRPGPVLGGGPTSELPLATLRSAAIPHLERLVDHVHESVNLLVLSGAEARFVHTVECSQLVRVGDRSGKSLPAHRTSAGQAMLAALAPDEFDAGTVGLEEVELRRLRRVLPAIRRNGFAINHEQTETGLTAIGVSMACGPVGSAGISMGMPAFRFSKDRVEEWVRHLRRCADAIERSMPTDAAPG